MHPKAEAAWNKLIKTHLNGPLKDEFILVSPHPGEIVQKILANNCFEPKGLFRSALSEDTPQIVSWVEDKGNIIAYAILRPVTMGFLAYCPDRIRAVQLGMAGVWVNPAFRGLGLAHKVMAGIGRPLQGLKLHQFIISAEERIRALTQKHLPLLVLPRWAYQQISEYEIKKKLNALRNPNQKPFILIPQPLLS